MAEVVKHDFSGLRIQYQGDRIQALFHLPKNDDAAFLNTAVETAAGLQSSMGYTLKQCLPEAGPLDLAIGIDLDVTLVSKIGTRGQRDRICIGTGVEEAARTQESLMGARSASRRELFSSSTLAFSRYSLWTRAEIYMWPRNSIPIDSIEPRKRPLTPPVPVTVRSAGKTVTITHGEEAVAARYFHRKPTRARPWYQRDKGARLAADTTLVAENFPTLAFRIEEQTELVFLEGPLTIGSKCGITTTIETRLVFPGVTQTRNLSPSMPLDASSPIPEKL